MRALVQTCSTVTCGYNKMQERAQKAATRGLLTCTQSSQQKCTSQPGEPHLPSSLTRVLLRRQLLSRSTPTSTEQLQTDAAEETRPQPGPDSGTVLSSTGLCVCVCNNPASLLLVLLLISHETRAALRRSSKWIRIYAGPTAVAAQPGSVALSARRKQAQSGRKV